MSETALQRWKRITEATVPGEISYAMLSEREIALFIAAQEAMPKLIAVAEAARALDIDSVDNSDGEFGGICPACRAIREDNSWSVAAFEPEPHQPDCELQRVKAALDALDE
jgi:hypothetical protein